MSDNLDDHFMELLFVTLFSTFFASRLGGLENIQLTLGTHWDTYGLFIVYNLILFIIFYRTRLFFSSRKRTRKRKRLDETLYKVLIFGQTFSPYSALQFAWWYEFQFYGLSRGLLNNPEKFTIPIILVYSYCFAFFPIVLILYNRFKNSENSRIETLKSQSKRTSVSATPV